MRLPVRQTLYMLAALLVANAGIWAGWYYQRLPVITVGVVSWDDTAPYTRNIAEFRRTVKSGLHGVRLRFLVRHAKRNAATEYAALQELIQTPAHLIYALSASSAATAKAMTSQIPILFSVVPAVTAALPDPVRDNTDPLVSAGAPVMPLAQQLRALARAYPDVQRIGFLYRKENPHTYLQYWEMFEAAADTTLELIPVPHTDTMVLADTLRAMGPHIDLLYAACDPVLQSTHADLIADFAKRNHRMSLACLPEDSTGDFPGDQLDFTRLGRLAGHRAAALLEAAPRPTSAPGSTS